MLTYRFYTPQSYTKITFGILFSIFVVLIPSHVSAVDPETFLTLSSNSINLGQSVTINVTAVVAPLCRVDKKSQADPSTILAIFSGSTTYTDSPTYDVIYELMCLGGLTVDGNVVGFGPFESADVDTVSVLVPATPPTFTTNAAGSVTSSGATLNGTGNPNGKTTTGWFRYSTTNPGTCNDSFGTRAPASSGANLGAGASGVAYSASISGLSASTVYYYCAIGSNADGTAWGSPATFTTSAAAALPDLTAGNVTPLTAVAGISKPFSAAISNIGTGSTGGAFSNFMQWSSDGGATANDIAGALSMSTILGGGSDTFTMPYTFPSSGHYSLRVCADKTTSSGGSVIAEPQSSPNGEFNNCGGWPDIVVAPNLTLTALPATITLGDTVTLTWTPTGAGSCWMYPPLSGAVSATNGPHTRTDTPPSTGTVTYSVECWDSAGLITSGIKTAPVTVNPALTPAALNVCPATGSVVAGSTLSPALKAWYTPLGTAFAGCGTPNGSDVTATAGWSSSSGAIASVGPSTGVVTGVNPGSATITKSYLLLSDTAVITVSAVTSCTLPWGGTISDGANVTAYQNATVVYPASCVSQVRTCSGGTLLPASGGYTNQTCTPVAPDLRAGAITPTTAVEDTTVPLQSTISNVGTSPTAASFWTLFQRATDASGTGATDIGTYQRVTAVSAPSGTFNATLAYSGFTTPGTFYVRACADKSAGGDLPPVLINENTNEGDNCSAPWTSITISASVLPTCPLPWGGTITLGSSVTAYQSASVISPAVCVSQTRTCGAGGTLSGTYLNQACTVSTPAPTATLLPVSGVTINRGQSTTLNWSSTNADTCASRGGFTITAPGNTPGSTSVGPLCTDTSYQFYCDGSGGHADSNIVSVTVNQPSLSVTAVPVRVAAGSKSRITWSTDPTKVASCKIVGPGVSATGASGSRNVTIDSQSTFTLTCKSISSTCTDISKSVTVNILQEFDRF